MPKKKQPDTSQLVAELQDQIRIVREIDKIRDQQDCAGLHHQLLECLTFLARELEASSALVCYFDAYQHCDSLMVDASGLIKTDSLGVIEHLTAEAEKTRQPATADPEVFKGNYFAMPLELDGKFIGILGIGKDKIGPHGKYAEITNGEKALLQEAVILLDTEIRKSCQQTLARDELAIVEAIDEVSEDVVGDLKHSLPRLFRVLTSKLKAMACLIFEPDGKRWKVLAADNNGDILWNHHKEMKHQIQLLLQRCHGHNELLVRTYDENVQDFEFVGRHVRSVVARPLMSRRGEMAGALIVLSDLPVSDGHRQLIERVASMLDTVILNRRQTNVLMNRYGKYVGADTMSMLMENPQWLDPRQAKVVVLSADLVGSTEYASSEANPKIVFKHVNHYLSLMGDIIKNRYHGTLDKYIGDEVMALFGAPLDNGEKVTHAVACAQTILREVKKNQRTKARQANV